MKNGILKIVVFISVLITILVNALANILPINGYNTGEISDDISIYFVPAGYVFAIWGLIYLALMFYAVYTFFDYDKKDREIAPYVIVAGLANISWIFLWHYKLISFSVIPMLILLGSLLIIYLKTSGNNYSSLKRIPFQIYLGWISVASIANIAGALYLSNWTAFNLRPELWSAIMIGVATVLGILMTNRKKDFIYPLVLIWAVVGIFVRFYETSDLVVGASTVSVLALLGNYISNIYNCRHRKGEKETK